ncbi:MAG: tripartite tricarboxylate transporter substrate binding protein [Alphaproteobacteria bacterium]|nr:tripartite tricarboxylate transporter substrate binding protein [Alphaproteobacteria bacterium]
MKKFVLVIAFLVAGNASAQTYPGKPVRLVVPFPPGGGADIYARTIVPGVSKLLGQPIVVDNRPGSGGNVGAEHVSKADPDGYTILYGTNGTHAINHTLYKRTGFDAVKDFAPVSRMTQIALLVVTHPSVPANDMRDLVAYLKANPKTFFGSAGNGTTSHLAGEMFKTVAGVDMTHVPYKGGAPAMIDLIAGRVPLMIEIMGSAIPHAKAGKIKALAVTTAQRFPTLPEVPTIAEAAIPGFQMSAWDGIFTPAGTPRPVIDALNGAIRRTLEEPEVRNALLGRGAEPVPSTPEELGRHVAAELERWGKVVKASGASVD